MSALATAVATARRESAVVVNTKANSFRGHLRSIDGAVIVIELKGGGGKIAVPTTAVRMVRPLGQGEKL